MTTPLPNSTDFTGSAVTEGMFKTAITGLRGFLADLFGADGANSTALKTVGAPLNEVLVKSANYTVAAADRGKVLSCTGSPTIAFTAAATLGNGFVVCVRNDGTGIVTLDPNGAELVDGSTTITLPAGTSVILVCDGTQFMIASQRAAATANGFSNMQVYTASNTWTVPAGITRCKVVVVGGGGGGATYNSSTVGCPPTVVTSAGASGGNGGYAERYITGLTPGTVISVTVGAGGASPYAGSGYPGMSGSAGGTSSFGSYCSATAGTGGIGGGGGGSNGNGSGGTLNLTNCLAVAPYGTGGGSDSAGRAGIVIVEW